MPWNRFLSFVNLLKYRLWIGCRNRFLGIARIWLHLLFLGTIICKEDHSTPPPAANIGKPLSSNWNLEWGKGCSHYVEPKFRDSIRNKKVSEIIVVQRSKDLLKRKPQKQRTVWLLCTKLRGFLHIFVPRTNAGAAHGCLLQRRYF